MATAVEEESRERLKKIIALIRELDLAEREYLFGLLDTAFCLRCGEAFKNKLESDEHECPYAEDEGDEENEDEEGDESEDESEDEDEEEEDEGSAGEPKAQE